MELKNNILLKVATANSRKAKSWKNKELLWSEIVEKMSVTVRTAETVAEYRKMSKDQQSDIKDVGAIVGGYCNNGSRTDIRCRSIVALDADYASPDLWSDWLMNYGYAAAIYSTHKHTPEKPRLRLMIPLSRDVSPDEYQAIGRRIAADLDIEQFDDTTYQPQRIMFWPSTSQDGQYVFDYVDAPALDPDTVLSRYTDWRDISAWPMSSRVSEIVRKEASKQADPLEKSGLVGAFCRAYSIREAIETFIPTYTQCADPNRYTYTEGSTAAGVVIYEDKFSYSNHATDPASGQLCNAWDLVRLHLFGEQDADTDPAKKIDTRPSWKSMVNLVMEDGKVKKQLIAERAEDFDEELPEGESDDWMLRLKVMKDGSVASTIENIVIILQNDPNYKGRIQYDEMSHNIIADSLPWRPVRDIWTDSDDASLRYMLEKRYGLSGKDKIFDAVNVVAMERKFHPVRDYLDSCTWDGQRRIDTLLIDYLGAEDSEYTRAVTRKSLVAAVARIYRPGCKFDYMLTFRGAQGIGKSTLIRKLGGKWCSDSFTTLQGKDSYEQLMGVWIMEVGELAGMRKAEAETIKLYISKQVDRFRPAYGRRTQEFPRQCVFIGTTNETQILKDATGNRRFWIVDTPEVPTRNVFDDLTETEVSNIWAEAVELFRNGEKLYLSRELEAQARIIQARYEEENPRKGMIEDFIDRPLPDNWEELDLYSRRQWLETAGDGKNQRQTVSAMEIYAERFGGNPDKIDNYLIKEINNLMSNIPGWRRMGEQRITTPYGRQRFYRRVT